MGPLTTQWLCRLLELLTDLEARLARGESVYVHCWGGRGRAGLVAACFLQHAYGISGEEALQRVGRAYDTRGDTGVFTVFTVRFTAGSNQWQSLQLMSRLSLHLPYLGSTHAGYRSPETEQQRKLVRDFAVNTRS